MGKPKISIIGAGHVGEALAIFLAEKELGDVVLLDIIPNMPQGKGLDMCQTGPVFGFDSKVKGTNSYDDIAGSDIVVLTAGKPRSPGMSRDDLINVNFNIVKPCSEEIRRMCPDTILIVVSNPLDSMVYTAYKVTGFPRERLFGMAGILDNARFRTFLSMEIGISVENIQTLVLGGHGDTMVPCTEYTTVSGIPITRFVSADRLSAIVERTRMGGGEIVKLLGTSAYYAPAAAVVEMIESILKDKKKLLPCCAMCQGEFGLKDIFFGVPVILGKGGMEKIVEVDLNEESRALLEKSAKAVRELHDVVDKLMAG